MGFFVGRGREKLIGLWMWFLEGFGGLWGEWDFFM